MWIVLRKREAAGLLLLMAGFVILAGFLFRRDGRAVTASVNRPESGVETVLVWDAGHGGADGGAVSADGAAESGINLAIARNCRDLCLFLGQRAVMTRTDEGSLADEDAATIRGQKISDTRNRVALVNSIENAVLISIHQNSLPTAPKTHGAMVFYNAVSPAEALGVAVQDALNQTVNSGNEKCCRAISGDIYLMAHANCPAVLVECGFLSHAAEAALLQTPAYQTKLACAIVCGYLPYKG